MMRPRNSLLTLLIASGLCACSVVRKPASPDNEPTLKTLASREVAVEPDPGIQGSDEQTIAAYRQFLAVAPKAPQRAEAMRRLGDLEMGVADQRSADATGANGPDYRAAIARYEEFLKAYPQDPGNDRVLYQLARAHEQGGELEAALQTLDRLVRDFPQTGYRDEAHFRRGELLFAGRHYPKAEQAYAAVIDGDQGNPYRERALYMHGWSLFKQGRLDEALGSFFGVLDLKLGVGAGDGDLDSLAGLSRADRELVEDTFRVTSLSLQNLQGAESIPPYMDSDARRAYEFRVYQQLGELYIKQDRTKDAADTLGAFTRRHPLHAQAPVLQARVIEIYQQAGFATLALDAKKAYVAHYGIDSEFRRANPAGWEHAQPLVKTHLSELARHYHASAQKSKNTADYQEAVRWYRAYIASFPSDPEAAQNHFLLAELLFEDRRFDEAAAEYEKVAYHYPPHPKSADAGYAALLSYAEQEKRGAPAQAAALRGAAVESALRFAKAFPTDTRTGPVLTHAAETLYALRDAERAAKVAQQVLALEPAAAAPQRKVAWTVVGHTAFERGDFATAERAYGEVLGLTPEKDPARGDLQERQAAAIYKQGEQARAAGQPRDAVAHFQRVATVAPQSAVRATAQYDAAASLIGLKDWAAAAQSLEDFRQRHPNHPLQGEVAGKLAVVYLEQGRWAQAAGELERLAADKKDPRLAREAHWQAAELYEKAADKTGEKTAARAAAAKAYERYLQQYPQPLEPAVEARFRLARLAKADGNAPRELAWMQEVLQADQRGGGARTDRTRYLGARAALAVAEPSFEAYRKVALVEPLAKQLKLKKTKMEETLKAYGVAADYGVAEVTTAATFHTAALYQDFGRALLGSQRPKRLSKAELEQYDVLLEEQAYPFEEKATELHEVNARRAASGLYDEWVRRSYSALAQLQPVRYGKSERSEGVIDAIR
ncbi:tetratricopeptide repeat protein [Caldimonas brevitalea]|uniref:Outer membrane lipoprotein BamD-like domain-containing protein n=1 Tax=Caldimonas brevitalea TaxID=413882 RepID=A0A0G3BML6_9BURK|nr:tetratricopeptide repeat protein [Caldimonas brevitalea]AKJ29233.1 hypothetical protein AAW51_2542 [Caldimonas brevitalea]